MIATYHTLYEFAKGISMDLDTETSRDTLHALQKE